MRHDWRVPIVAEWLLCDHAAIQSYGCCGIAAGCVGPGVGEGQLSHGIEIDCGAATVGDATHPGAVEFRQPLVPPISDNPPMKLPPGLPTAKPPPPAEQRLKSMKPDPAVHELGPHHFLQPRNDGVEYD